MWSAPGKNQVIADTEGETVAWCTKPGRGTRIIPPGAITGVQFLRAPGNTQMVQFRKQMNNYIGSIRSSHWEDKAKSDRSDFR